MAMKQHITVDTIVDEVRMGSNSQRPRAVFLASDATDVKLLETLLTESECRVVQAHSRENAARAFEILVKSGWEGVVMAVNSGFAPTTENEVAAEVDRSGPPWRQHRGFLEQIQARGGTLSGQRVRVTVLDDPEQNVRDSERGCVLNAGMLGAISSITNIVRETKPHNKTQLNE